LAPTGDGHTVSARQASRSYESHALTRDVSQESLELRDALCFQNEFSGIDWIVEGYYKFFAEAKPACRSTTHLNRGGGMATEQERQLAKGQAEPEFAAFVAIDWADKVHYFSLRMAGADKAERGNLENSPEAVELWAGVLERRFGGRPVAVALEQRRGALVAMLGKYSHLRLYPVHPLTLSKYREAWYPSRSKDDVKDADLLLEILVQHRDRLRRIDPDIPSMRLLQFQVENRRKLVDERTALGNRLTDVLKICFPQVLKWFDDVSSALVGNLLEKWPTLEALQKARTSALEKFLREHNCRDEEKNRWRLEEIRNAVSATHDEAVMGSAKAMVPAWVGQIAVLRQAIGALDKEIAQLAKQQEDWAIFQSLPGAGDVLAPRLMAAMGTRRERFRSADELQCFTGIAPVKEASGNSEWVHIRWACPKFQRQTFHEWAACSIPQCAWAKTFYDRLRARGKDHHVAVRALAFKWMRILYRCWVNRTPYKEDVHLASLARRSLPLRQLASSVQMP
jgi:transposase